ncbi:MAG: tetratricopeptide repeat protein [Rickettsiaceae bacterium]|nr:tetratricopeptide repeat protein [Rickettsiaceae bacterium]
MSKTHLPSSSQSAASNTLSAQDWLDKGNTLFAKQKLQAIAAYDRAIQLKPDDALYHCSKGKVLQMLGNEQLALEFYNKAYEISKTASLGSNLSQGNIQYIKNTLSKDRESLLLKIKTLQETSIETQAIIDTLDANNPVVQKAARRFTLLKQEKAKVINEAIDSFDEKKVKTTADQE